MVGAVPSVSIDVPKQSRVRFVDAWNLGWPINAIGSLPRQIDAARVADLTRALDHCQRNWVLGIVGDEALIRAAVGAWNP